MKYDLKGHIRSNKTFYAYLFSSNNSSVKSTLLLMLPQIVCALLSPILTKKEGGGSLFAHMMLRRKLRLSMILRLGFMWPLLCYGDYAIKKKYSNLWIKLQHWLTFLWTTFVLVFLNVTWGVILKNSHIFWSNYNLDLCSSGKLLSLFLKKVRPDHNEKKYKNVSSIKISYCFGNYKAVTKYSIFLAPSSSTAN